MKIISIGKILYLFCLCKRILNIFLDISINYVNFEGECIFIYLYSFKCMIKIKIIILLYLRNQY